MKDTITEKLGYGLNKTLLSLSVFLIATSFFIFTIGKVNANHTTFDFPDTLTQNDIANVQQSNGRYMMQLSSLVSRNKGEAYWYFLVWDTQTGRSKFYYGNATGKTEVCHSKFQLPANPL